MPTPDIEQLRRNAYALRGQIVAEQRRADEDHQRHAANLAQQLRDVEALILELDGKKGVR